MAIFVPGPAVSEIRGSSGGTVFSRNRFGQYTRQRSSPVNPNSPSQILARGRFNDLATRWRDTLTAAQRDAWDLYAANTNWINGVGQVTNLTGLNHYVRSNGALLQTGGTVIDDGPIEFGIPDQETLWASASDSVAQQVTISYTFTADVDDQWFLFFQGQPISGSRNFFAGPWRYLGAVQGDSTTPPTSPEIFPSVYPLGTGQKSFVYCRRIDADGRLTQPFRDFSIVT